MKLGIGLDDQEYVIFRDGYEREQHDAAFPDCPIVCYGQYENAFHVTPRYPMPAKTNNPHMNAYLNWFGSWGWEFLNHK